MNTKVKEFFSEVFGEIRTVDIGDDKIWFVAKDIAEKLGFKDTKKAIRTHCKNQLRATVDMRGGEIGNSHSKARKTQEMVIINIPDVTRLIVKSRLDDAIKFESWLFNDVIPALYHDGMYVDNEEVIESREKLEKEIEKRVRHKMERLYGKDQRFSLTEELSHLPSISPKEYANYTNVMYNAIFGYKAKELYKIFNAKKGKLRDEFSTDLIILIREAEKFELNLIKSGITDKNMIETLLHNWKESYIKDYIDFKIPHYN